MDRAFNTTSVIQNVLSLKFANVFFFIRPIIKLARQQRHMFVRINLEKQNNCCCFVFSVRFFKRSVRLGNLSDFELQTF